MRTMMRPQKTQLPDLVSTSVDDRKLNCPLYLLAGYRNFDAIIVGAAGGYGARVSFSYGGDSQIGYPGGPGGGGSIRVQGAIENIDPLNQTLHPGDAGADRSAVSNGSGPDGYDGGSSSFAGVTANGGKGGQGGRVIKFSKPEGQDPVVWFVASGGDGGTNSKALGSNGQGGEGEEWNDDPNWSASTPGTSASTSADGFTYTGGRGGGGGVGRLIRDGVQRCNWHSGSAGADGSAFEGAGAVGTDKGGPGGGADISVITESEDPQPYGSKNPTAISANGAVSVRLT